MVVIYMATDNNEPEYFFDEESGEIIHLKDNFDPNKIKTDWGYAKKWYTEVEEKII